MEYLQYSREVDTPAVGAETTSVSHIRRGTPTRKFTRAYSSPDKPARSYRLFCGESGMLSIRTKDYCNLFWCNRFKKLTVSSTLPVLRPPRREKNRDYMQCVSQTNNPDPAPLPLPPLPQKRVV